MSRGSAVLRLVGGLALLAFLLHRFGGGPLADAWRVTTWQAVLAAFVLTAVATVTSAWRWRVVARSLGVPLGVRESVAAYYRSQLLNAVLHGASSVTPTGRCATAGRPATWVPASGPPAGTG